MKKTVNRLNISGLEINGVMEGSSFVLRDFTKQNSAVDTDSKAGEVTEEKSDLKTDSKTEGVTEENSDLKTDSKSEEKTDIKELADIFPFLPPVTEISHSFFNIKDSDGNSTCTVPFSLLCKIDNKNLARNSSVVNLLFTPVIFGQRIKISIEVDIKTDIKSVSKNVLDKNISDFENPFRSVIINVHNISWSSLHDFFSIVAPESNIKLTGSSDITLSMKGDISKWKIAVLHIGIKEPLKGEINNVVLNLTMSDLKRLLQTTPENTTSKSRNNNTISSLVSADGSFWFGNDMISPVNVVYGLTMSNGDKWSILLKGREMWKQKPFIIGSGKQAIKLKTPDFQIYCNGDETSFDGKLTAAIAGLVYEEQGIRLGRVDCKLPFKYIGKGKTLTFDGKVNVDGVAAISLKSKVEMASGKGLKETDQTDNGLKANFSYRLNPVTVTPDLIKKIYTGNIKEKPYDKNDGQDIFSGMDFSVSVASDGEFSFYDNQMENSLTLNLNGGRFAIPESKININGINTSLSFKGTPDIKPLSAQILTVENIDIKDLRISNAKIRYTIESTPVQSNSPINLNSPMQSRSSAQSNGKKSQYTPALLIENACFDWCDGKVISESMRFSSTQDDYHVSLFCDRLKLSSILHQVGAFDAEGDGTLNGRIPISVSGGNITFDNGFLYSAPGQGGKIKVYSTEKLTEGIPADTPQFNQLDLAREALKSYQYEWARLGFNTQGDQLLVKMEFDGKPENALPFVYKKELGSFVRVNADKAGSHFQGIKIDVNLQLPFNRVLRFGNGMNNLFKQ
jgi:hypothetical protein